MMLRWTFLTLILLAVTACATPPKYELETTEQVIEQARTLEASRYAPTEFEAATQALGDGRILMQQGEYGKARQTLKLALEHARRSVAVTQEARVKEVARQLAEREAAAAEARQAAERQRAEAEAEARRAARKAAEAKQDRQTSEQQPPPPTEPEPTKPTLTYQVGEGETLWTIAAQPVVYDDAHLWPLLYQANRDQIKNPRQIFPGQILNIRRDLTQQEIEEARQKARESDIFPVPVPES